MDEIPSPDAAVGEAKRLRDKYGGDIEVCHYRLDALMCYILRGLGYTGLVDEFDDQDKLYA